MRLGFKFSAQSKRLFASKSIEGKESTVLKRTKKTHFVSAPVSGAVAQVGEL
jgi:hypothetical protein